MKKLGLIMALCALLTVTAVACGGDPPSTSQTGEEPHTNMHTVEATEAVVTPTESLTEAPTAVATELPTEAPTEVETQDPLELCAPTYIIDHNTLHKNATLPANPQFHQQIREAKLEEAYVTLVCDGNDPYVAAIKPGTRNATTTHLVAIKYRTVDDTQGEMFIGSGSSWTGSGDHVAYSYIPDGAWHLLLVDLSELSSLGDKNARYMRFDFFGNGAAGRSIDVQYIAFFKTAEEAVMYDELISAKDKNDSGFASHLSAQTSGASGADIDLGQYFEDMQGAALTVGSDAYILSGAGSALRTMRGTYAMTVDMTAEGKAYVAARLVEDRGILATASGGSFELVISGAETAYRYTLPAKKGALTVVDNGDSLFFLVGDELMASVTLLGRKTYDAFGETAFATVANVRLANGSEGKLQDLMVAADPKSGVGFVVKDGALKLREVRVMDMNDVTVGAFGQKQLELKEELATSDRWTVVSEEVGVIPNPDRQCTTKQGGWTDGIHYYQLFIQKDTAGNEENNVVRLVKYNLETGEVMKISEDLKLNHANDLTYNPKRNVFVAVHNKPHRKKLSIIDPDTFEVVDTVTLDCKIFSLDYNAERDQYVIGIAGGQTFRVLNADFTYADDRIYEPTSLSQGYTTQGVTCDDQYIYFVLYNQNCLTVYDWEGNFISYVTLDMAGEPENLSVVGNEIYISSALQDGAHIFRIVDWKKPLPEQEA